MSRTMRVRRPQDNPARHRSKPSKPHQLLREQEGPARMYGVCMLCVRCRVRACIRPEMIGLVRLLAYARTHN